MRRSLAGGITLGAAGVLGGTVSTLGSGVVCCGLAWDIDRVMWTVASSISVGAAMATLGTASMFTGWLVAVSVGVELSRSCWRSRRSAEGCPW